MPGACQSRGVTEPQRDRWLSEARPDEVEMRSGPVNDGKGPETRIFGAFFLRAKG